MDLFSYFSGFYDQVQDSVAIFNAEGHVFYCNDAFSVFTGYSVVRFQNKKATLQTAFKTLNNADFSLPEFIEMANAGSSNIVPIETKALLRGLAQIAVKKLDSLPSFEQLEVDEPTGDLYLLTVKDLTLEEELNQSFKSEINNRNKKLQEMNQLIEILQKIRLLENPYDTINEFVTYMLASNKVCVAASRVGDKFTFITEGKKEGSSELPNSNPSLPEVLKQINAYLKANKTSKYICIQSDIVGKDNELFHWSVVPFKFGNSELFAIFIFESTKQKEDFAHQSAIILSEQLNLILNNLTLKEFAITDGLTKLRNSLYFREQLEILCSKHQSGQLLLFDVDFFKKVNDTYGHLGGDAVLIMLGEKVPFAIRKFSKDAIAKAIVARVGGEEFAIFIPNEDDEFGLNLAEAIRTEIESTEVTYNNMVIKVTISIGLAAWKLEGYSNKKVTALYKTCDEALYMSKKGGRNRVSVLKAS